MVGIVRGIVVNIIDKFCCFRGYCGYYKWLLSVLDGVCLNYDLLRV